MRLKKFIAYLLCLFSLKAAAEAVNSSASVHELDEKMLSIAGFKK